MNFQKTKQFEEEVFRTNEDLLVRFMGSSRCISTDYATGELFVFDNIGIDKVFYIEEGHFRTTSLRCRKTDWSNITIRGHISEPKSQASKIYNIQAKGSSYADYTLQVNGVNEIHQANSTLVRINNRHLSSLMFRLHSAGMLENYFHDKGQSGRFYEFTYSDLQKYSVVPYCIIATAQGWESFRPSVT